MRFLLSLLVALAMPASAFAADLSILRQSTPAVHWGGFYGGFQYGYSSSRMNFAGGVSPLISQILRSSTLANDISDWAVLSSSVPGGTAFGGFVGYNFEFEDVIIGAEANYNRYSLSSGSSASISREFIDNANAPTNTEYQYDATVAGQSTLRITDIATFRLRVGWEAGCFLPYAFGGFALGRADVTQTASVVATRTDIVTNPVDGSTTTTGPTALNIPSPLSNNQNGMFAYGWAAGVGLDYALLSNVFVRGEYEYVGFAPIDGTHVGINSVRLGAGLKF